MGLDRTSGQHTGVALVGEIIKSDEDEHLLFGWATVVEKGGKPVTDSQHDQISPDEIEAAAYDFVIRARVAGDMHERIGTGYLVESMVFTKEKQEALGIDIDLVGWWVGFHVHDDKVWNLIKEGKRPMFSIGGIAQREEIEGNGQEETDETSQLAGQ